MQIWRRWHEGVAFKDRAFQILLHWLARNFLNESAIDEYSLLNGAIVVNGSPVAGPKAVFELAFVNAFFLLLHPAEPIGLPSVIDLPMVF
mgnify:CR=1 FL=1